MIIRLNSNQVAYDIFLKRVQVKLSIPRTMSYDKIINLPSAHPQMIPSQQQNAHLFALLGARCLGLAIVDARLVQNALDDELYEPVVPGHRHRIARIRALPVARQKLLHQRIDLAKALDPGVARIPVLVLEVIREPGQGEQQTETAILVLARGELLDVAEDFDDLLDGIVDAAVRARADYVRLGLYAQQLHVLVPGE